MSMLEIIFSFTMFVTVMVPLMSVWVTHAKAFDQSQNQEVAGALAQMYMEQALNTGYNTTSTPTTTMTVKRTLRGQVENSLFNYTVAISDPTTPSFPVVYPPDSLSNPPPSHKVVVVIVAWSDATGNHTVSMESNAGW